MTISLFKSHCSLISEQTIVYHSPGALCTVDRSFGPILDHTFHHISDTHVCHHLFSKMPFYHAQEATECIRKVLGPYYMKDETPLIRALYRSYSACQFIEDDGDIVFYKNIK
jgi:omega-6 fatty acid desaturase / acyl-lipid omega-6 desaturase (Delta-12 desaturase)